MTIIIRCSVLPFFSVFFFYSAKIFDLFPFQLQIHLCYIAFYCAHGNKNRHLYASAVACTLCEESKIQYAPRTMLRPHHYYIEHWIVRYTISEQQQQQQHREMICKHTGGLKRCAHQKNNGKSQQYAMKWSPQRIVQYCMNTRKRSHKTKSERIYSFTDRDEIAPFACVLSIHTQFKAEQLAQVKFCGMLNWYNLVAQPTVCYIDRNKNKCCKYIDDRHQHRHLLHCSARLGSPLLCLIIHCDCVSICVHNAAKW